VGELKSQRAEQWRILPPKPFSGLPLLEVLERDFFPHINASHTEDIVWHQGKAGSEMLESGCHLTFARLKKKKKGKLSFFASVLTFRIWQDRLKGGGNNTWKRSEHCLESGESRVDVCRGL